MQDSLDDEWGFWENTYGQKRPASWSHLKWVDWYYPFRSFDRLIRTYIKGRSYEAFLDLGSGQGNWLIYAAKRLNLKPFGIDYSPAACQLARANLARSGVHGVVVNSDFLSRRDVPPVDVVYLGGVIEHYADPLEILRVALGFLKPGGTLINRLPTSLGLNRCYWRLLRPDRLATLVPVSAEDLVRWYEEVGLEQTETYYNGSFCLNMFPKEAILPEPRWMHRLLVHWPVRFIDALISSLLIGGSTIGQAPESLHFSPFVIALGTKPLIHPGAEASKACATAMPCDGR